MESKILNIKKIILATIVFFTTCSVAQTIKNQPFWEDAEKGYIYNIGHYKNINLNVQNEDGQTPLMIAVKNGHSSVVDAFSEGIVDITMQDFEGKTAFDYIKIAKSREEEMHSKRIYGALRTLEIYQMIRGKAKMLQYSYQNDTDILQITIKGANCDNFLFPKNTQCNSIKEPKHVNQDIFKAIKKHNNTSFDNILPNVDIEMKDKSHYSLLWRAIISKNLYAVDQLLQQGADINGKDNNNHHTPIFYATIGNDSALLKVLLKHDVDVNSKNQFGNYVLSTSMFECNNFETITLLLDNGANPYLKDRRGETVFDKKPVFCKNKSNIEKMSVLLKERSAFSQ